MNGEKPLVSSVHGMVAAAHPLAAFAGAQMLRAGGNAFDAAVATAAALNVVEPFMSGLAGLGVATCFSAAEQRVRCLDFTPAVPQKFKAGAYTKQDLYAGPKASGVPGNLAGWHRLSSDYGQLDFASVLQPAVKLAEDGFPVTGGIPTVTPDYWDLRSTDAEWVRVYTPGHAAIERGWILRQPDLARSLRSIAEHGPAQLYGGALGRRLIKHIEAAGGLLSLSDLEAVSPNWVEPLRTRYKGRDVHTLPPPDEAFQFLLTLAILDPIAMNAWDKDGIDHLDALFRAVRLAAEQRIRHNRQSIDCVSALMSGQQLDDIRRQHDSGAGMNGRVQQWRAITDPDLVGKSGYTTSLSTADAHGNMVCITQSLGSVYGSGVVVPGTGICLNNFLNWTDIDEPSPNRVTAGERMAMCLAPSITTRDDQAVLALGTPGSYGILHTQVQAMVQYLDFGVNLQAAIDAPRARLWDGNLVHLESRIAAAVTEGLQARGHDVVLVEPFTRVVGGMQAIERDPSTGALTGAADSRRDGYCAAP